MPTSRRIIGTSISPRTSTNAVNEVVNVLSRKLNTSQQDNPITNVQPRRPSFSMETILHPGKKERKRDDSKDRDSRTEKRLSIVGVVGRKDKPASTSPLAGPIKPAKLELIVESPPLVLIGNITNSSGALFSGRIKLTVTDPSGLVTLNNFDMVLRATLTTKRPIGKDCRGCLEKHEELKKWKFLSEPKQYRVDGNNQIPFSYLLNGRLPATTDSVLGSLSYSLYGTAVTSTGEKIELNHPLMVQRAVPPGPEKLSIRIFPPTNLTGRCALPPVVHPIGTFPVELTLSGVVDKRSESQTRWRLRKLMWRVEEHSKIISQPCQKHLHKVSEGKAVQSTDITVIGQGEEKSGWKTDFDTPGGEIFVAFDASVVTKASKKAACDMESGTGLEVKHHVVIELIVAEEFCPNRNTNLITPTGAARVLRMSFGLLVTERLGMGVSWDEEQPPMYDDVPPSPPCYGTGDKNLATAFDAASMEDYNGPTIVPHDLERVSTENPNDPPLYREIDPVEEIMRPSFPPVREADAGDVPEASTTRRRPGLRLDDLEIESAEEAYRRQRQQEHESTNAEADYGEGEAS